MLRVETDMKIMSTLFALLVNVSVPKKKVVVLFAEGGSTVYGKTYLLSLHHH